MSPSNRDQENSNLGGNRPAPSSLGAPSNDQLGKLESEIGDIKTLLKQQQELNAQRQNSRQISTGAHLAEGGYGNLMLDDDISGSQSMMSLLENNQNEEEIKRYVQQQKGIIKKTQEKIEQTKRQYKLDKQKYQDPEFKKKNPKEFQRQKQILDEVKDQIEDRIDKLNQRVEKIKKLEQKMKSK